MTKMKEYMTKRKGIPLSRLLGRGKVLAWQLDDPSSAQCECFTELMARILPTQTHTQNEHRACLYRVEQPPLT